MRPYWWLSHLYMFAWMCIHELIVLQSRLLIKLRQCSQPPYLGELGRMTIEEGWILVVQKISLLPLLILPLRFSLGPGLKLRLNLARLLQWAHRCFQTQRRHLRRHVCGKQAEELLRPAVRFLHFVEMLVVLGVYVWELACERVLWPLRSFSSMRLLLLCVTYFLV